MMESNSQLLFANEFILFCRVDLEQADLINHFIRQFNFVSSHKINFPKDSKVGFLFEHVWIIDESSYKQVGFSADKIWENI